MAFHRNPLLVSVTETEITKIVRLLKDSATGHDDVFSQFPQTRIYVILSQEGVFPDSLKMANDIPLHISEDPLFLTTTHLYQWYAYYQNTLTIIIYDRLIDFVKEIDLSYGHQYGSHYQRIWPYCH